MCRRSTSKSPGLRYEEACGRVDRVSELLAEPEPGSARLCRAPAGSSEKPASSKAKDVLRCRCAVSTWRECPSHSAGGPSRCRFCGADVRPRRAPGIRGLQHGFHSSRFVKKMRRMVGEFAADEAAFFELDVVQAGLWARLMRRGRA